MRRAQQNLLTHWVPLTLRFCQNNAGQSYDGYYLIPLLEDVDITPTRSWNPGGVDSNATAFGAVLVSVWHCKMRHTLTI